MGFIEEQRIKTVSFLGSAGELIVACGAQTLASLGIKTALSGTGLSALSDVLVKAEEAKVLNSGQIQALQTLVEGVSKATSEAGQLAEQCAQVQQSVAASPAAEFVTITCNNAGDLVAGAVGTVEKVLLKMGEQSLGPLRMAGLFGLASLFLTKPLIDRWGQILGDNEFFNFVAAQGTLVLACALANSLILAPVANLEFGLGDFWGNVGVGLGMATMGIISEVVARNQVNMQDMGTPGAVVFGTLLHGGRAVQGALRLLNFLR